MNSCDGNSAVRFWRNRSIISCLGALDLTVAGQTALISEWASLWKAMMSQKSLHLAGSVNIAGQWRQSSLHVTNVDGTAACSSLYIILCAKVWFICVCVCLVISLCVLAAALMCWTALCHMWRQSTHLLSLLISKSAKGHLMSRHFYCLWASLCPFSSVSLSLSLAIIFVQSIHIDG